MRCKLLQTKLKSLICSGAVSGWWNVECANDRKSGEIDLRFWLRNIDAPKTEVTELPLGHLSAIRRQPGVRKYTYSVHTLKARYLDWLFHFHLHLVLSAGQNSKPAWTKGLLDRYTYLYMLQSRSSYPLHR